MTQELAGRVASWWEASANSPGQSVLQGGVGVGQVRGGAELPGRERFITDIVQNLRHNSVLTNSVLATVLSIPFY